MRVAIAGATGFAGQELIRLLARHPHVTITAATGSQATSTPRQPAVARAGSGTATWCRSIADGRWRPTPCFWRCRKRRPPSSRRRCSRRALRVIDLSGAFRLRDEAARAKWYPATTALPDGVAYGLTEFELEAIATARLVSNPGCYPTASLLGVVAAAARGPAEAGRRHHHRREVGHFRRRQGRRPIARTFRRTTAAWPPTTPFGHRHTPEMEQALGQPVTFVPHLVPLDRGILVEHVRAPRARARRRRRCAARSSRRMPTRRSCG